MKKSLLLISSLLAAGTVSAWADATIAYTDSTETGSDGTTINVRTFTGSTDSAYYKVNGTADGDGLAGTTGTGAKTIDKLVFNSVGVLNTAYGPWFTSSAISQDIDLQGTGLTIKGGSSSTGYVCFNGTVTGVAGSAFTWLTDAAGNVQNYVFTGDLSGFAGNFVRTTAEYKESVGGTGATNSPAGVLQFGADTAGTVATNTNISGTGSINTSSVLRYNYSGANTAAGATATTDALVIGNSSITARYLILKGGANYSVSNSVTGYSTTASENTLHIAAGTTTFNGAVSNFGNVIAAGTLALGTGGSLDLSGATVTLSNAISNEGSVKLSATTVFVLDNLTASNGTYSIISGGEIDEKGTAWDGLSYSNFTIDGLAISRRSTLDLNTKGSLTITAGVAQNLVWAGTASDYSWNIETSNTNWTNSGTSNPDYFATDDNVTFSDSATNKNVVVANNTTLKVGTATIESGVYVWGTTNTGASSGATTIEGTTLTIASGASLQLGGAAGSTEHTRDPLVLNFDNIALAGTLSVHTDTGVPAISWSKVTFEGGSLDIYDAGDSISIASTVLNGDGSIGGTWGCNFNLGNITGTGTLTVSKAASDTKMIYSASSIGAGATLVVAQNANLTQSTALTLAGTLTTNGTTTITGNITADNSSATATLNGSGTVSATKLELKAGATVNITGGDYTFSQIQLNNSQQNNANSLIIDGANVTVTTTEKTVALADGSGGTAALVIGHWGGTATHTLELKSGTLDVLNGYVRPGWTSAGTLLVSGGEANVYGISVRGQLNNAGNATVSNSKFELSGGRVNIGEGGIIGYDTKGTVTLSGGTIGALANWETDLNSSTMSISNTVTFDTTLMSATAGSVATSTGTGATITLGNVISGDGALVKEGLGTLVLGNANTYSGGTTISGGKVVAKDSNALGTGLIQVNNGTLVVAADGGITTTHTVQFVNLDAKFAIDLTDWTLAQSADEISLTIITAQAIVSGLDTPFSSEIAESHFDADNSVLGDYETWQRTWEYVSAGGTGTLTLTLAIPEPSMFGLLAGTLALALAGTRRRRKNAK